MNSNRDPRQDSPDEMLDHAIRAAIAQPPPGDVRDRVLSKAAAFAAGKNNRFTKRMKNMILAHKRLSAAAATVTALAAGLIVYVVVSAGPAAYALEETAQANDRVTSYHFRTTPAPVGSVGEGWIELNPDGSLLRARIEIFDPYDGPKVSIVTPEKAEVWLKIKHRHLVLSGNDAELERFRKRMIDSRVLFDPKLAFEHLQAEEKAGKVKVETREPDKEGGPISLTVTSDREPDRRRVFDVDPESKLVMQVVEWKRQGEQWQVASVLEYLDYNKPFGTEVFQFQLPHYVTTIDRTTTTIGLEPGTLGDEEIAVKVAREFFEALIAGDYEKASPLFSGVPAEQLKRIFTEKQIKFLRVVEVGKPVPHELTRSLKVPVTVEMEVQGKKVNEELSPLVRKESGRWTIHGGI